VKKLTELDLQNAMDECTEIKFRSHGEWLAGMVKRLNKSIIADDITSFVGNTLKRKSSAVIIPVIKTTLSSSFVSYPFTFSK